MSNDDDDFDIIKEFTLIAKGAITLERERQLWTYCDKNDIEFVKQTMSPSGIVINTTLKKSSKFVEDIDWIDKIFIEKDDKPTDVILIEPSEWKRMNHQNEPSEWKIMKMKLNGLFK